MLVWSSRTRLQSSSPQYLSYSSCCLTPKQWSGYLPVESSCSSHSSPFRCGPTCSIWARTRNLDRQAFEPHSARFQSLAAVCFCQTRYRCRNLSAALVWWSTSHQQDKRVHTLVLRRDLFAGKTRFCAESALQRGYSQSCPHQGLPWAILVSTFKKALKTADLFSLLSDPVFPLS